MAPSENDLLHSPLELISVEVDDNGFVFMILNMSKFVT